MNALNYNNFEIYHLYILIGYRFLLLFYIHLWDIQEAKTIFKKNLLGLIPV